MWYNFFALLYDRGLERLYHKPRQQAVQALNLTTGDRVLDLPCGTGQSFDLIESEVGKGGLIIGIDRSRGMLGRAVRRVNKAGWNNVALVRADVHDLSEQLLAREAGTIRVDAILCALGLSTFPEWEAAFTRMFDLLRPGGRFVVLDVHASQRTRQTRAVELLARADLSREVWIPLEANTDDFSRNVLKTNHEVFGGDLFIAAGTKPSS